MSEPLTRLKSALADRYTIEREIGAGGMATVWLAEDVRHGRQVAIKVLHPELAATLGVDRFLREIEIAGKLTHPNILTLHDSGQAEGLLFYVMPYVEGESLAERLRRETHLPVDEALEINAQVAAGLQHAHQQGVIHRDIKPDNILLPNGHAVIADFGIARAVTQAGADKLTQTGLAVGTPAYMSPEQASATSNIDARTDLYSLACVLYEMLAGSQPFTASTPQALVARHAIDPVPSLTTVRTTVPPAVEAAITRALAKVPADRFATVAEFVEALTRTDVVAAATTAAPDEHSIAVLPFANMSTDPENEYFSDGMAEEILNALTRVPNLRVAARTSSFIFKGRTVAVAEIGHQLKVAKVLEGSVRQAGNRLRITAQLINVADGYHLWSERYDREMTDVFAIQDDLTEAIVGALKVKLSAEQRAEPLVKRGTKNLEAYDLYLRGRNFWHLRNLAEAIKAFQQAIAKDPSFALPYTGLADALVSLGLYGFMPARKAHAQARDAAERALAIEPEMPEALCSVGSIDCMFDWDLQRAEERLREALSLNPHLTDARAMLLGVLGFLGRSEELQSEVQEGCRLEPRSAYLHSMAGFAYLTVQQPEKAAEAVQRAVEIEPYSGPALAILGWAYHQAGRITETVELLDRAVALMRRSPIILMTLGGAYAQSGRTEEARALHLELRQRSSEAYVPPVSVGFLLAALGEIDEAMGWIEKAFDDCNPWVVWMAVWPGLDDLRSDARYVNLLEKAGFAYLLDRMT